MKIVMVTNTYLPHVGGVAKSVDTFSRFFRQKGHQVWIVAPEFAEAADDEADVLRVPAIQNFNGSDFSVSLAVPPAVSHRLKRAGPDLIHSHHPFLLGDSALRLSASLEIPLVFTHHTMYEHYTHYVPVGALKLKRIAVEMAVEYCNLCDQLIAPSESVEQILRQRGVVAPMKAIPTGIDLQQFRHGDGAAARQRLAIPADAFVLGHVGRLAEEKNCVFMCRWMCAFLKGTPDAYGLVVGAGPCRKAMEELGRAAGVESRMIYAGTLTGQTLVDAYHAFDLFAFASKTETQGMVLAESMSAGVPVVALDAPGVREVVEDARNGCLVCEETEEAFLNALRTLRALGAHEWEALRNRALETARGFDAADCADRVLYVYREMLDRPRYRPHGEHPKWENLLTRLQREWEIWSRNVSALASAWSEDEDE